MLESGEFISFSDRIDCNRLEHGASEKELDYSSCCRQKRSDRSSSSIRRLVSWCYCWGAGIGMLLQLVVVALLCVKVSYTSTHWVVSDDGRLKSVDFSPYLMQEPGDLINFMKQEERVQEASKIRNEKDRILKEMNDLSFSLSQSSHFGGTSDQNEDDISLGNEPQVENGLRRSDEFSLTDANCSAMFDKNSPTKEMDHYLSIHLPLTLLRISVADYLDVSQAPSLTPFMPFCSRPISKHKEQKQFDKLKGFIESMSFSSKPEPDLRQVFDGTDVDQIGHLINMALLEKSECWVLCSLATLFWRIKGNSQEALKCAKQAYDVAPADKVAVTLVNMAAVLHKHHYHADASSLALKALKVCEPTMKGFVHLLLAQIQCTPQMDELEKCLENLHSVLSCDNHCIGTSGPSHFLHSNIKESIHAYSCLLRYKQQLEKEQYVLEKFMQMQKEYHLVSELHAAKMKEIDSYKVSDEEYLLNEHLYRLHTNKQFSELMDYFKGMEMSSEELDRHLSLSGSPLDMEMQITEEETYILSDNPDGSVFLEAQDLIDEGIDVSILCEEEGFDCHQLEFRAMQAAARGGTLAAAASSVDASNSGLVSGQTDTLSASATAAIIPPGAKIIRYGHKKYFLSIKVPNNQN